jgi:parallel beta-helix repeat protein
VVGQFSALKATKSAFTDNGVGVTSEPLTGDLESLGYNVHLTGNVFSGNDNGIYLPRDAESGVRIGQNVAAYSSQYGIFAPGATDLGGNKAVRNAKPCVGVVCTALRRPPSLLRNHPAAISGIPTQGHGA